MNVPPIEDIVKELRTRDEERRTAPPGDRGRKMCAYSRACVFYMAAVLDELERLQKLEARK